MARLSNIADYEKKKAQNKADALPAAVPPVQEAIRPQSQELREGFQQMGQMNPQQPVLQTRDANEMYKATRSQALGHESNLADPQKAQEFWNASPYEFWTEQVKANPNSTYAILNQMYASKETPEEKAKRERREQLGEVFNNLGNLIGNAANLYYTTKGGQYIDLNSVNEKHRARMERLREKQEALKQRQDELLGKAKLSDIQAERAERAVTARADADARAKELEYKRDLALKQIEHAFRIGQIDAQTAAADLDLSATVYESETFPATFAGTADAKNTTLKSITFPVNVTIVSASAFRYCAALESVNLDEIVNIGDNAFRNTGLKKVKVDKQVKTLGTYIFAECHDLEDIYFNATDSRLATPASGGTDFYTFVFDIADIENHTVNMVATIGPDSRLPRYAFRYNANLSKIIFESTVTGSASNSAGRQGNNSLQGVRYLGTVITKGNNWLYNGSLTEAGVSLPTTTTKYLVVPDGQTETYKGWRLWTGNGTTGALEKMGFTMIEQSAYDALQAGDQN